MSNHTISIDPDFLYKPVKIETRDVLFQGCWHLNHDPKHWDKPIWAQRGFDSAREHFDGLINNWNSVATNESIGFSLGDLAFGNEADQTLEFFLRAINFSTIYLMGGNHTAGIGKILGRLNSNVWQLTESKRAIFIPNYFEAIVCGQSIAMSHYPILSHNGAARGSWMLYSHVHGNLGLSDIGKSFQSNGKSKEVSVEVAPFPLSFNLLKEYFKNKESFAPDHHTANTQNPF
jgi:calcineurin-like phosphoesterase family protein